MPLKYVLFDLDGTLLPMDMSRFVHAYLDQLGQKFAAYGYDPIKIIDAVQAGTFAMMKNEGGRMNEEVFWECFEQTYGEDKSFSLPILDEFYRNEFNLSKQVCGFNPEIAPAVKRIRDMGYRLVVATNPLFPAAAVENRIRWSGLTPELFDLYTTYGTNSYVKPKHGYYREVLDIIGALPEECLMVGNDVIDDMTARELGLDVFLLTDCLINKENKDISVYPNGGVSELLNYIEKKSIKGQVRL